MVVWRILFGFIMIIGVCRQFYHGWIEYFYMTPAWHFTWEGFSWIRPLPSWGMYVVFGIVGLASLLITLGKWYRLGTIIFFLSFTYIELIDKTTYLNHYYLVSILGLLMIFIPLAGNHRGKIAQGWLWLMRIQVGLVYFFAGIAKLNTDWLLRAQPLKIWLTANQDFPVIGSWLTYDSVAFIGSWGGAAFDLTVPFLLCWKRTRMPAFLALVAFHLMTAKMFQLGLFPWLMIANATLFFAPNWPSQVWQRITFRPQQPVTKNVSPEQIDIFPQWLILPLVLHLTLQIMLPFRHHLYSGNFMWHETGYRFSWHVMLTEKTGLVRFIIKDQKGHKTLIYGTKNLTQVQLKMMSTQPDMIVQFAHHLADLHPGTVGVYVESYVSLNGRKSMPFIDPHQNLLAVSSLDAGSLVLPLTEE